MTIVGLLLAVLLAAEPATTIEPPDEVRVEVERWLRQLDASSLSERRRAEQELLDLGPKVLRWLPPKELVKSPATWDAVQRISFRLQKQFAQESTRPARVTIHGKLPLPDLLQTITRQTANPLRLADDDSRSARFLGDWGMHNVTFWEAIDQISNATELSPASRVDEPGIVLERPAADEKPIAIQNVGVLRAEILSAALQPIAGDPQHQLIRLRGELVLEPRLRPLFVHFKAGDFQARNAEGEAIPCWNPEARYELPMVGASRRTQLTWDFVTRRDAVPENVSFQGKVLVQLAAATEPIRFDRLQTDREVLRRRGGVSVRLHQVEFDEPGTARVKISVNYDTGGPAFESHRTWVYHNAAWLESEGRRLPFTDFEALQQGDGSVQLEYRFQKLPPPASQKFVYEAPTLLLDVPFELDFREVPVGDGLPE